MMLSDLEFSEEFERRYGIPLNHVRLSATRWIVSKWSDEAFSTFPSITFGKNSNFLEVIEKQIQEASNDLLNKRNTTFQPLQIESKLSKLIKKYNIHLQGGLTESAKRDTGETSTTIDWIGLGTDGTAELFSQTGLGSAYGSRKQFSVDGYRSTLNQTAKYGMLFTDADLTVPVTLREAVTFTASTGGIAHHRLQYTDFSMSSGQRIAFAIYELHQNG